MRFLNSCFTQPQTITYYKHAAERHRARRQHRDQETHCRRWDQDDVVEERPEQVLLDGAERFT